MITTQPDTEQQEETAAVMAKLTHGTPIPPGISRRIRARAAKIREEDFRMHGVQNIGDDIIREIRS